MALKYALATLCLVTSIFADPPAGAVVLGYRTVSPEEATKINNAQAPVWDGVDYGGGRQTGAGCYTTPIVGGWPGSPGDWFCIIYASADALDRVSKVKVPQYAPDGTDLWWSEGSEISDYVIGFDEGYTPSETLYLSYMSGEGTAEQCLIPPGLIDPEGDMGLWAVCTENQSDLPETTPVDYESWNNMQGDYGDPDE